MLNAHVFMCNLTGFKAMSLTDSRVMILKGALDVGEWSCTPEGSWGSELSRLFWCLSVCLKSGPWMETVGSLFQPAEDPLSPGCQVRGLARVVN